MGHTIAVLEKVRAKLTALPKPDRATKTLSNQDSIEFLAKQLLASLRDGHTIEEVATVLAAEGIELTPTALKSYLQRTRLGKRQRRRKNRAASLGSSAKKGRGNSTPSSGTRELPSRESTAGTRTQNAEATATAQRHRPMATAASAALKNGGTP